MNSIFTGTMSCTSEYDISCSPVGDVTMSYEPELSENLGDALIMQIFLQNDVFTIDLRQWETDCNGKLVPTKKGIQLSLQTFIRLLWLKGTVQNAIEDISAGHYIKEKLLVGGPVFMELNSPYPTVYLREYVSQGGKIKPGWRGIFVKHKQWQKILEISKTLDSIISGFSSMQPCFFNCDHANQEGALACSTCNYFCESFLDEQVL